MQVWTIWNGYFERLQKQFINKTMGDIQTATEETTLIWIFLFIDKMFWKKIICDGNSRFHIQNEDFTRTQINPESSQSRLAGVANSAYG